MYGRSTVATAVALLAASLAVSAVEPGLDFLPDPGVRVDSAGLACPSYDASTETYYLYYDDSRTHRGAVATSQDGLAFEPGREPTEWRHDPRVLILPDPDAQGESIYRRYLREPDASFISESSPDGVHFRRDEGARYVPQPEDNGLIGVCDHFVDSDGGIALLYIGDMHGVNNVRRAYSPPGDNGWAFVFDTANVLGDAEAGGGSNSYVDQKSVLLPDGRRRLFVMKRGTIYSFISEDDGRTFRLEPGARLEPSDFAWLKVQTLHDPWPILLPDGRVRIYLHGYVEDGPQGRNVILSATSRGPG